MKARRGLKTAVGAFLMAVIAARCGSNATTTTSTTPTPVPTVAPTPVPTPAGIVLPAGMICDPTPPPLKRVLPQMWRPRTSGGWILDTKPQVMNYDGYCERTSQSGGKWCDTRPEGDAQRVACDYLAVGISSETGRWGPTWTFNGKPCDLPNAPVLTDCNNDPDNQFKAIARGPGLYQACASPLARVDPEEGDRCGQVLVP